MHANKCNKPTIAKIASEADEPPCDDDDISVVSVQPTVASTSFLSTDSTLLTQAAIDHPLTSAAQKRARSLYDGFNGVDENNLPKDPSQLVTVI